MKACLAYEAECCVKTYVWRLSTVKFSLKVSFFSLSLSQIMQNTVDWIYRLTISPFLTIFGSFGIRVDFVNPMKCPFYLSYCLYDFTWKIRYTLTHTFLCVYIYIHSSYPPTISSTFDSTCTELFVCIICWIKYINNNVIHLFRRNRYFSKLKRLHDFAHLWWYFYIMPFVQYSIWVWGQAGCVLFYPWRVWTISITLRGCDTEFNSEFLMKSYIDINCLYFVTMYKY